MLPALVAVTVTCIDGADGRPTGSRCSTDDECADALLCVYGRCRPECLVDQDCPDGSECVDHPDRAGIRVCRLPDELADADGDADDDRDVDGTCEADPCRPVLPQCGCDPGLACQVADDGTLECGAPGTGVTGDRCAGQQAPCAAGFICQVISADYPEGVCTAYCDSEESCDRGALCVPVARADGDEPTAWACTVVCDLLTGGGCGDLACDVVFYGLPLEWTAATLCRPTGPGEQGDPCDADDFCAAGHACDVGTCRAHCLLPDGACPASSTCQGLVDPHVIGGVEYGLCI